MRNLLKTLKIVILLQVLLQLVLITGAANAAEGAAKNAASLKPILDVKTFVTPAGINVWLVEDTTSPAIYMDFAFRGAGAVNDPDGRQGVSQLLSNTLDEGAGSYDSKAFQAALNDHSIGLNFSSTRDDFGGHLDVLKKYQDTGFELLHLALSDPHLDAAAIERMKQANLSRIRSNMIDPDWLSARLTNAVLFAGHPYARNSGGTLSQIPEITRDDLLHKFRTQLAKDNLVVAVAGNISAADLSVKIDQVFGALPDHATLATMTEVGFPTQSPVVHFKTDIEQNMVNICYAGMKLDDPDYTAAQIFNYVAGGAGFGSRLMDEIREKRGLTYGIYSGFQHMNHAELWCVSGSTRAEQLGQMRDLVTKTLADFSQQKITRAEFCAARAHFLGSIPLGLTSNRDIAAMLNAFQLEHLPPNYLDLEQQKLESLTLKDVEKASRRILTAPPLATLIVGPNIEDTKTTEGVTFMPKLPDVE